MINMIKCIYEKEHILHGTILSCSLLRSSFSRQNSVGLSALRSDNAIELRIFSHREMNPIKPTVKEPQPFVECRVEFNFIWM